MAVSAPAARRRPYTLRTDPRISIAAGFQRIGAGLLHITAGLDTPFAALRVPPRCVAGMR